MFTTKRTWEQSSYLQKELLHRFGQRQYRVVEVPFGATLFYVELLFTNPDDQSSVRKKYCITTLANTQDFLASQRCINATVSGQICKDGRTQFVKISKIISMLDEEQFENLYFECEDGSIFLDGIGAAEKIILDNAEILWSCQTSD